MNSEALVFKDYKQALKFFVLFSVLGVALEFIAGAAIAVVSGKPLWYYPESPLVFSNLAAAPLWGFYGMVFAGVYFYYR